jgi:peptide/nickel transport system substrate-binding protein
MKKLLTLLVVLLVGVSILFISCKTTTTSTSTSQPATTSSKPSATITTKATSATAQPVSGGILRCIITSLQTNIGHPGIAMGPPGLSLPAVEPLTSFDTKGNLIPELATSWDLDANAKTITLHLRKSVKFHDGTDFNATACKWNYEQYFKTGKIQGTTDVSSIDTPDDYTVRINFTRFSALYVISFTHTVMMYSPTAIQTNGDDWAKTHIVGTGPFKQTDYKASSYWKFTRNDNYWGPKPYLDGIEYTVVADTTVANLTMRSGGADEWLSGVPLKDAFDLQNAGFNYIQRPASVNFLCTDSTTPNSPFANQKVREAVEYAIDRAAIAKAVGYGSYHEVNQFANPDDLAYNPDIQGRAYSVQKAKQLLSDAGYPNGFKTKIYCQSNTTTNDIVALLQSYLASAGITLDIDVCDSARWLSYTGPTGWKDGMLYATVGRNAGYSYIQFSLGNQFKIQPNSGYQVIAKSPAFTDLYNQLIAVPSLQDSVAVGKKIVKQMYDDAMVVPLWNSPYSLINQKYVHTNFLSVHHQIWNSELDWMDKH